MEPVILSIKIIVFFVASMTVAFSFFSLFKVPDDEVRTMLLMFVASLLVLIAVAN